MRLIKYIITATMLLPVFLVSVTADEFTKQDLKIWQKEFQSAVKDGRQVFRLTGVFVIR
jgi:hypothetical protein